MASRKPHAMAEAEAGRTRRACRSRLHAVCARPPLQQLRGLKQAGRRTHASPPLATPRSRGAHIPGKREGANRLQKGTRLAQITTVQEGRVMEPGRESSASLT